MRIRYRGLGVASVELFPLPPYPDVLRLFLSYGVPFTVYDDGGYAGATAIVWAGVIGDVAVLLLTVAVGAFVWHISERRR